MRLKASATISALGMLCAALTSCVDSPGKGPVNLTQVCETPKISHEIQEAINKTVSSTRLSAADGAHASINVDSELPGARPQLLPALTNASDERLKCWSDMNDQVAQYYLAMKENGLSRKELLQRSAQPGPSCIDALSDMNVCRVSSSIECDCGLPEAKVALAEIYSAEGFKNMAVRMLSEAQISGHVGAGLTMICVLDSVSYNPGCFQ